MPDTERNPHVARVGWSTDASSLNVGEDRLSYGYGGTGKSSFNNKFLDYGQPYGVNDIISCYIDFDSKHIFFSKNGLFLGKAFDLQETNCAFFPHVTIKNMKVQVNFGCYRSEVSPIQGFTMINNVPKNMLTRGTRGPDTFRDCQVIMMVGLPGAGKTVWANQFTAKHKDSRINILGTNTIMDRMKVTGLTRQRNYHGRWEQLIEQATNVLNKMFKIAEKQKRNYILDQTNVYPGARAKKMSSFHGFKRTAAVIVNTNQVLKQRSAKREKEEGKVVPESAVMQMKANFTIPEVGELFDDVWFIEENQERSTRLVEEFREEGRLYQENEREREMKRKGKGSSEEPRAKESCNPYNQHTGSIHTSQYPPRDQGMHQPLPLRHPPREPPAQQFPTGAHGPTATGYSTSGHGSEQAATRYPPGAYVTQSPTASGYPPRAHGSEPAATRYPPEAHVAHPSVYSPRGHGSELPTPRYPPGAHETSDPQHPPRGHGAYDARSAYAQPNYQPRPPQPQYNNGPQDSYSGYYQQAQAYLDPNHYQISLMNNCYPYSIPETYSGGCTPYDSFDAGRQPQENDCRVERQPSINDERRYGNNRHNPYNRGYR